VGISLFALEQLTGFDRGDPLLITEGESDTLAAREAGFQALGCPGAHAFRPEWRDLIEDFSRIHAVGDGDEAGQSFAWSVRAAVPWARPVVCPTGEDLRSLLQSGRRGEVEALLADADEMARLEHAVLEAPDLVTAERWLGADS
jgi:DNA primase